MTRRSWPRVAAIALAAAAVGGAGPPAADPSQPESDTLRAGRNAPVHDLDSTLGDGAFQDWMDRTLGEGARVRWEENDCGESSGSAADSARDLPVCAEASAVLSGGRELTVQIVVGTSRLGVVPPPALYLLTAPGPDSSVVFHRLSELEQYLDRERPFLGNEKIYLDDQRNVRVVTSAGRDVRLTKDGPYRDPRLGPDGQVIGMLPVATVDRADSETPDPVEVATELWIYQGGRVARRFQPGGFIRAWGFVGAGDSVAVSSGALHFAGFYVLYDLATGNEVGRSEDPVTDRSPEWVRSLAP